MTCRSTGSRRPQTDGDRLVVTEVPDGLTARGPPTGAESDTTWSALQAPAASTGTATSGPASHRASGSGSASVCVMGAVPSTSSLFGGAFWRAFLDPCRLAQCTSEQPKMPAKPTVTQISHGVLTVVPGRAALPL